MEPLTPTPASQWKTTVNLDGTDLELPSGNVARVRNISPQTFITSGMIPDPLSAIIRKAIHTNKGLNPKDMSEIVDDPDKVTAAFKMFDQVLAYVMVEPAISMPPPCDVPVDGDACGLYADEDVHKTPNRSGHHAYHEGPRNPNLLYADVVDLQDKMFIFQWALGGTRDLEQFREESDSVVEAVSDGQGNRNKAKRSARRT